MDEGFASLSAGDGGRALYVDAHEFRQRHVVRELRTLRGVK